MKTTILMLGISILATACGAVAPSTEMPSTTQTTGGAPVPGATQAPSTDKPLPPLDSSSAPPASMQNTTTQSTGDSPTTATPSTP